MMFFKSLAFRTVAACAVLFPAGFVALQTAIADSHAALITENTLPETVGAWNGVSIPLTDRELSILHAPSASQRMYSAPNGDTVQVLLVQVDNTQNAHDPRLCMDGSGYTETASTEEPGPWSLAGDRNEVSHSVFSRDGQDRDMYYWMATPRGNVANMSIGLKMEGLKRALRGEPTKGIAIRVLTSPNAFDPTRMTSPERARALWAEIRTKIRFEEMLSR